MAVLDRREFVKSWLLAPAFGALAASLGARVSFASAATDRRFVFVLLRGGLDGLSLAPAWGDPDFERARAGVGLPPPGEPGGALRLDDTFALHPQLPDVHALFARGELSVLHAVCSPYRERSHFDAQNVLECGGKAPYALRTGWLNRALAGLPERPGNRGVALGSAMPICLRGDATVSTWSPSLLPEPRAALMERVERMYAGDETLSRAFAEARQANALIGDDSGVRGGFSAVMRAAAEFLREPAGPSVAMVEATGWDTHASQELPQGALWRNLAQLNAGLRELRDALGDVWGRSVVLVLTEFGRTVAMNGSRGTDHGTGGAGLLLGGAVAGGRVIGDWPGLAATKLHEGRDLLATLDTRAVVKGVLRDHLGIAGAHLEASVFPDSKSARPLDGLVREPGAATASAAG